MHDRAGSGVSQRTSPFDEALSAYQRERGDHVLPMCEFTCQLATLGNVGDDHGCRASPG